MSLPYNMAHLEDDAQSECSKSTGAFSDLSAIKQLRRDLESEEKAAVDDSVSITSGASTNTVFGRAASYTEGKARQPEIELSALTVPELLKHATSEGVPDSEVEKAADENFRAAVIDLIMRRSSKDEASQPASPVGQSLPPVARMPPRRSHEEYRKLLNKQIHLSW